MTEFDRCYPYIQTFEGGKADNKKDPGGRTAYGITQRTFDADCDRRKVPRRDVWTITQAERAAIYQRNYWLDSGADKLPWALDLLVFDTAVNSGVGRATEFLGYTHDPAIYLAWRLYFVRWLAQPHSTDPKEILRASNARTFLKGWEKRIDTLRHAACPEIPDLAHLPRPQ